MDAEVLSWLALVAERGSEEKARRAVADGDVRRVLRGAYVPSEVPDDLATRAAALRLVLPDDVVLSHWAALWVLGLDVLPRDTEGRDLLDVIIPRGRHLELRPGLLRPHSALVPDEEVCEVEGLLAVSAARAFVDVARSFGLVEGVACADAALRNGATTRALLCAAVDRAEGLRWVTRARTALQHLEPRSESLMESRLRVGFVLAGGPRMAAQVDLYDDSGRHRGRADLYLDGVAVEYDGRAQRLLRDAFVGDRRRGNDLSDLAVEVRRFTADDYYRSSPAARLEVLQRALALAAGRSRPRLCSGPDTLRPGRLRPLPTRADLGAGGAQAKRTA